MHRWKQVVVGAAPVSVHGQDAAHIWNILWHRTCLPGIYPDAVHGRVLQGLVAADPALEERTYGVNNAPLHSADLGDGDLADVVWGGGESVDDARKLGVSTEQHGGSYAPLHATSFGDCDPMVEGQLAGVCGRSGPRRRCVSQRSARSARCTRVDDAPMRARGGLAGLGWGREVWMMCGRQM